MTAAALTPKVEYVENGVTVAFAAPFRFLSGGHLRVTRFLADGTSSVLALGAGYTVTGGATDAGGTVTVTAAAAAGTRLRIERATPRAQAIDYATADTFPAETHELGLDRAMLIDQEQDAAIADVESRAVRVPVGEGLAELPNAAARALKYMRFTSLGALALLTAQQVAADLAPYAPPGPAGPTAALEFYPENFPGGGPPYSTMSADGTIVESIMDHSDAIEAAMAAAQLVGGTVRYNKWFNARRNLVTPNNGGIYANGAAAMNSFSMRSASSHSSGQSTAPAKCGGILFCGGAAGVPRIQSHGLGLIDISGLVIACTAADAANGRPIWHTSNTTLRAHGACFWTPQVQQNCLNDPIVFGGRTTNLGSTLDSPFQGYVSSVMDCAFMGVRTVRVHVYANALFICNNWFSHKSGSNEANGSAILLNGNATNATNQYCATVVVHDNQIESGAYKRPIYAESTLACSIRRNAVYDADGAFGANCGVYLGPNNIILSLDRGLPPVGVEQYVINGGAGNSFDYRSASAADPSIIPSAIMGTSGYPVQLKYGIANGPNGSFGVQPVTPGTSFATHFFLDRAATETVGTAGGRAHGFDLQGGRTVSGLSAGEMYNAETNGASFTQQARKWSSAIGMTVTAGGGNPVTLEGGNVTINTSAGTQVAKVGPLFGGSGFEGIGFGTALDVSIWRANSTTIAVTGALRMEPKTVAGLGSATTAGAGAHYFCTNEAGGATPVFSDATNWRRVHDRAIAS